MIALTKLDKKHILVNPDLILTAEQTPDTTITFSNGERLMVLESPGELRARVIEYKRALYVDGPLPPPPEPNP